MTDYILDTNALLRYLLNDIPSQVEQVKRIFADAKQGKCRVQIDTVIIAEAIFVLLKGYKIPRLEISNFFSDFLEIPYISIEKSLILREALLLFPVKNVSFVDLFLVVESRELNKTLVTFDRKLKRLVGKK